MPINIDVALQYQISDGDMVLLILEAARSDGQSVLESDLEIENATLRRINPEGAVGQRIWANVPGRRFSLRYRAKVDVTRHVVTLENLAATPLNTLPGKVLTYLRPSRFCQSDLFTEFAAQQFGHLNGGAKIASILDWVTTEMSYVPGSSNAETTAVETFRAREGVCRDYAHVVCSLARAARIPARYTSVYGARVTPPDFHAVAEVWLDGAWHLVDATGMGLATDMVVIGAGRDAADVAFMETEHWADPISQSVAVSQG